METAREIRDALFIESRKLLHDMIPRLAAGDLRSTPQDERRRTYFSSPQPQDMRIDWAGPLDRALRVIRACSPRPGAAATADGSIRIHDARVIRGLPAPSQPGQIISDPDHGLIISCADSWLQVVSLTWDPSAGTPHGTGALPEQIATAVAAI